MTKRPPIVIKNIKLPVNPVRSFEFTNVKQGKAHKLPDQRSKKVSLLFKSALHKVQKRIVIIRYGMLLLLIIFVAIITSESVIKNVEKPVPQKYFLSSEIIAKITIPIYLPKGLPSTYTINTDAKTIMPNVLFFSVNGPSTARYSITQQAIPDNFDFTSFNKKYSNPDVFNADCGYVFVGQIGTNFVGSIRTNKNTWIILNSSAFSSVNELETIIRSLELM